MARRHRVADPGGVYRTLRTTSVPSDQARRDVFHLSHLLGAAARDRVRAAAGEEAAVLCVVVLRGGLLLYPGFGQAFAEADFSLLGMRRRDDGVVACDYMTTPHRDTYAAAVLIDCVAATGRTLLTARDMLAKSQVTAAAFLAAVVCSSAQATRTLLGEGVDVLGISLDEELAGDVVVPDLGAMDAGDLFSGLSRFHNAVAG
ncbi:uracil phosphoribosyltransferase [Rhizohabitans arisaemae]|uniref:uracil phosphoribosyltransferase n=1 Tax=Rhizohabitans arisaemae TaxID=2720610 RepID=UPI0024B0B356|nr:uracil phosphoribosyltransferase [Rhizohabitans arisaemae]